MTTDDGIPAGLESRDLVQRARGGDDDALTALLQRHLPALHAYVRARADAAILAHESCVDIVQSACREALAGLQNYEWRGEGSFRYWLFGVAMNKLKGRKKFLTAQRRDVARTERVEPDASVFGAAFAGDSPSQGAIAGEAMERLEAALRRLPDEQRELILMARLAGMSHREIATELGKQEGAVRTALHRALARLSTEML